MASQPPTSNPLGDLQINHYMATSSTSSPSTPNRAGPAKRKAGTASTEQQPDSFTARRKDAQTQLNNMLATLDAAAQPPPTLSIPTPKTMSHAKLRFAAIGIWFQVIGCLFTTAPSNFDYAAAEGGRKYQGSEPFSQFKQPATDLYSYLRCILCTS